MKKVNDRRGIVWGLSKITVLLGAVMLFTILWTYHLSFEDINSLDAVVLESRNIAHIIDVVGSSPSHCEVTYKTPETLSGKAYSLEIEEGNVTISLDKGVSHRVSPVSGVGNNFSCIGGGYLKIRKNNRTVEVF